ncbi:hypothetical protein SAY86_028946 [Trapa natans]|uniref:Protein kinase domain-containing protein n=1 Tax=Trapa natans TaxID=22666 RepID=A0AAN7M0J0_TRANT|nr:hypothetical protein SAY86_028946 [Trapa natans]
MASSFSSPSPSASSKLPLLLFVPLVLCLVIPCSFSDQPTSPTYSSQSHFFTLMKNNFPGSSLSDWNTHEGSGDSSYFPFCNFTGIACDAFGQVTEFDVSGRSLSGRFPSDICSYLLELRTLRVGFNDIHGSFLNSLVNCSNLEELNLTYLYLAGPIPALSPLKSLRILDMSYNHFSGGFPISVTNLSNLEVLNFNENGDFDLWEIPTNISRLGKLKTMILTTCMVKGRIPPSIGNMTSLVDLELSGNYLSGGIPKELGNLRNLQLLELYYNSLTGRIPDELGNLTELRDLDMSVNQLTGSIPDSICRLPHLEVIQLYNNSLSGEIPRSIEYSTTLISMSLYINNLSGEVPRNLGRSSRMILLDLSENRLSGPLPGEVCRGGKLVYFLVLKNSFSGAIPATYANCSTLLRFRVSYNRLSGQVPYGILGLPHVSIIDIGYNNLSGQIWKTIGTAKNLSELFMGNNNFSGVLPAEISGATNLVKIDLSDNMLSGPIPSEIGSLKKLNLLMLQNNRLNSYIPGSLSLLKSVNVLDVSNNLLVGGIPESLIELLPNSISFSNNCLSGPIPQSLIGGGLAESFAGNPGLCVSVHLDSSDRPFPICSRSFNQKKLDSLWAIIISAVIIVLGAVLFIRRRYGRDRAVMELNERDSSVGFSYNMKSFHRISFDQREIVEAMIDKNIVGHGGSGVVYKIELSSREVIAVKRLSSRLTAAKNGFPTEDRNGASTGGHHHSILDKELKTEVETLGSIRHKNIVKLYCYFSSVDCSLLVYEYMPNGNLYDALHKGFVHLDWPTRHQIGLGIAQGLAYLHHDLLPPIIHRDIKSTNILLDVNYQPKVADFGIAKVLQARGGKDSTTTVIAGTYGYLAPEYAYSSKATTKCDVYSFGVVLMELVTGKKPVEMEFGENKNIIYWVSSKVDTKEGTMDVLDKRLSGSFRDDMVQVLRIAIRCTYSNPTIRPTMNEVVQLLIEADPVRFESCRTAGKTKGPPPDPNRTKNTQAGS